MDKNQISAIIGGILSVAAQEKGGKAKPKLNAVKEALVGAAAASELSNVFLKNDQSKPKENDLYELRGKLRGYAIGPALIPYIDAGKVPLAGLFSGLNGDFATFDTDKWIDETSEYFRAQNLDLREKARSSIREFYEQQEVDHPIFKNLQRFADEDTDEILGFLSATMPGIRTMLASTFNKYKAIYKQMESEED